MIQCPRPADLLPCLLAPRVPLYNVARTKDNLFAPHPHSPLNTVTRQVLFPEPKRYSLVFVEKNRLSGALSCRARAGAAAWEIDQLFLPLADEARCIQLLESVNLLGSRLGAWKIFLRVEKGSPAVEIARRAGFLAAGGEYLFHRPSIPRTSPLGTPEAAFRAKTGGDEFRIFSLYAALAPPGIRNTEGTTLEEWQASRERLKGEEVLYQDGDTAAGWLRTSRTRGAGVLELMALPSASHVEEALAGYGLSRLGHVPSVFMVVQEYQASLQRLCARIGFRRVGEYSVLARQLAVAVPQPTLVPMHV